MAESSSNASAVMSERTPSVAIEQASRRAGALAERLDQGARLLATLAASLSEEEWTARMPHDGRTFGVIVHHVASMYPLEIELAQTLAAASPIVGVTGAVVDQINAEHAAHFRQVTRADALELLRRNSAAAAAAIRALSDEQLDSASPVSLYGGAVLTCQFFLEDHPVRHSVHHASKMRAALGK